MAEPPSKTILSEENIHVELTFEQLDVIGIMNRVKSPKAGAIVLFAGDYPTDMVYIYMHLLTMRKERLGSPLTRNPLSSCSTHPTRRWR
jgi:hypothetical protein